MAHQGVSEQRNKDSLLVTWRHPGPRPGRHRQGVPAATHALFLLSAVRSAGTRRRASQVRAVEPARGVLGLALAQPGVQLRQRLRQVALRRVRLE